MILHKILLKPFVRQIETKQTKKNTLSNRLKTREHDIVLLQESKKTQLQEFRVYLHERYRVTALVSPSMPSPAVFLKNQQALDQLSVDAANLIIKKALNAY